MEAALPIVIRSIIVYLFIIFAIRLFGKKELSQLSVIDLVFILLISNSVQNAMVGSDSSLQGGLIAALSLFILNYILKNLFFKSKRISSFIQGQSTLLIYKGIVNEAHLKAARITHEELEAAIREHGVEDIGEVNLAVLEVDGSISIISDNFSKRTKKRIPRKTVKDF
jgi:uncharacterized membrane protein YcaP (DUF421 family)